MARYGDKTDAKPSDGAAMPKDKEGLFLKLQDWFKKDIGHVEKWRKEAREDYRFYNGDQWSEEDKRALAEKRRPALVFNRVAPLVNAVVGSEINNRREVRFVPREQGDAHANEVLTAAAEWFRDECGAEDEESDAFEDAVVSGMGWTDTRLDFTDEPDGEPKIERVDNFEMVWDCEAHKPNLEDAKHLFRVKEISYSEAVDLTGEDDPEKLNAGWVKTVAELGEPHNQDAADRYEGGQDEHVDGNYQRKLYTVVEARWFERETYYRSVDIETGQIREYSAKEWGRLRKIMDMAGVEVPPFAKQQRRVLRRCFIGSEVLGEPDRPMVPEGMFGWEAITGYRDKLKNQFYGVVKVTRDPQSWSNKFFSQIMDLLNSQSKGGIMAERGAFDDDRQAEDSWAKADAITYLKSGALSSASGPKVHQKPVAQFPQGFFALFQESKEAISQVTGLSQEFIGTREVNQPGVLEHQRRQSSLNLLASLFNGLRRYRKRQGRTLLYLIQQHLADGRLVRIVGEGLERYVPLTKADVADVRYDIIVDDSPTSPNEKERTWGIVMQMLPMVKQLMSPEIALELLTYSPLPASMVAEMKQTAAQMKEQEQGKEQESPEAMRMKAEMQKHQLNMAGKQADLAAKQQSHEMDAQGKAVDLMMKQQENEMDLAVQQQKAEIEMRNAAIKERANMIAAMRANTQRINSTQ